MPSSRTLVAALVAALAVTVASGATAAPSPDLVRMLRAGGVVLVFRHAATDFSKPDQDPVVVSDCSTQRNLSAEGRADARAIGRGVRRLGLPVGKVYSSAYCRTLETARLAFGRATVHPALLNTIARRARRGLAEADPRRAQAARHAAGAGEDRRARHTQHRRRGDDGTVARGGRGDRLPAARQQQVPRVVGRVLPGEWGTLRRSASTAATGLQRDASTRCPRARSRTTSRPARDGTSGTRPRRTGELGRLDPTTGRTTRDPARRRARRRTA